MYFEVILLFVVMILICWFCFSFFYMVNYLRRSGTTELNFFSTIISSFTGNISDFYKLFIVSHSKKNDRRISKFIAYSNILSFIFTFFTSFTFAIIESILV